MIANTLLSFVYIGLHFLLLLGLVYLALRYFDGQLTRRGGLRLAALICLPTLVMSILFQFLPYKWIVWPAWYVFDHFISVWTVLIPAVVFLVLWKGLSLDLQRAALYTGLFVALGMLNDHIFSTLDSLLPPYSEREPERKFMQALVDLGMLLIPVIAFVTAKTLRLRIPLPLGCFVIALLFSPVVTFSYGRPVLWDSMYSLVYLAVIDDSPMTARYAFKLFNGMISVGVSTVILMWLYGVAQRLRIPASAEEAGYSDR